MSTKDLCTHIHSIFIHSRQRLQAMQMSNSKKHQQEYVISCINNAFTQNLKMSFQSWAFLISFQVIVMLLVYGPQ